MALIKQVVSVANGTVTNIEMTPDEEAAFVAQQAINQAAIDAREAKAALLLEKNALKEKISDALITGDPVDPADVARYIELKAII